jgi:hypothetical protein
MGRAGASMTIETDDFRKTVEELKSRGVEFVSDVLEFPSGYVAQSRTPTATSSRSERAASPQGGSASIALGAAEIDTSASAGASTRSGRAAHISRSAQRTRLRDHDGNRAVAVSNKRANRR